MELQEVREIIARSSNSEWFTKVELNYKIPFLKVDLNLKGFSNIYDFVQKQSDGWNSLDSEISISFQHIVNHFKTLLDELKEFLHDSNELSDTDFNNIWRNNILHRVRENETKDKLLIDHEVTQFFISQCRVSAEAFEGAYHYLHKQIRGNMIKSADYLEGAINAFLFKNAGGEKIKDRTELMIENLRTIEQTYNNQVSQSEFDIIRLIQKLSDSTEASIKEFRSRLDGSSSEFNGWVDSSKTNFNNFDEASRITAQELESLYSEKLKLEEPAKYWEKRATKLNRQGWYALSVLVALVSVAVFTLSKLLWATPKDILDTFFNGNTGLAVRWSIIYITLLSFLFFGIRALSKVMFSSFHLARDCQERNTLTYFYLALLKDSAVDKDDRQLIMQSLFSRADTGLLKEDSSPTMPNDFAAKILGGRG